MYSMMKPLWHAEMLSRPISHAANNLVHVSVAQDAINILLEACLNKQPAFTADKLIAIFKQASKKDSSSGICSG